MTKDYVDQFGDAQEKLFVYIDWLYKSGRLTEEEHGKLLDAAVECIMKGVSFGSLKGEEL